MLEVMAWQLHDVEVIIDANKCNSILYLAWEGHVKVTNNIFCKHQNMDTGNKVDKRQNPRNPEVIFELGKLEKLNMDEDGTSWLKGNPKKLNIEWQMDQRSWNLCLWDVITTLEEPH